MPRGRKQPHSGNPATIASSTSKAATTTSSRYSRNSDSESDSESDVKISQDQPSVGITPHDSCSHDEQENAKRKACDLNHDVNDDMNSVNDKNVSLNSKSSVRHSNYQIVNTYTTKLANCISSSILGELKYY
ncbi:hypothetical protein PGT21_028338 [Puccinia graminis f. sp. tritici]|uniref:Uncharacterized protein n=1 Tax=Puccinia graminis f. sp. tritici TaxID=56615 RepID=A0A5B0S5B9_PUCGR|nr:hypothetical protein PGT21_028338 [Puccinia graminis f. sp. tritici]KAA1132998.1 hypothetical protein PGTUg99_020356 [Puccinia graminis f. sp. tritici]